MINYSFPNFSLMGMCEHDKYYMNNCIALSPASVTKVAAPA